MNLKKHLKHGATEQQRNQDFVSETVFTNKLSLKNVIPCFYSVARLEAPTSGRCSVLFELPFPG